MPFRCSPHALYILRASHPVMSTSLKFQKKKNGVFISDILRYIFLIYFLLGALVIFTCKEGRAFNTLTEWEI